MERICKWCGNTFNASKFDVGRGYGNFCSHRCVAKYQFPNGRTSMTCQTCGKEITTYSSKVKNGQKYCSLNCYWDSRRKPKIERMCEVCNKSFEVNKSQVDYGHARFCSKDCWNVWQRGKNAPNWQGGKTAEKVAIRTRVVYRNWREAVYARDNWTCQECGARSNAEQSVVLNAHHIFSYSDFPEHYLELWNGVTLCVACHAKCHPNINLFVRELPNG